MNTTLFSEARARLTALFDKAIYEHEPQRITSRKGHKTLLINEIDIKPLLTPYKLDYIANKTIEGFNIMVPEIGIKVKAATEEEATNELLNKLIEFSNKPLDNTNPKIVACSLQIGLADNNHEMIFKVLQKKGYGETSCE